MAEGLLNTLAPSRFRAFSAGSAPSGRVHPLALVMLASIDCPIEGLRSKAWDEFAGPHAPRMDAIITVCDDAAGESCPIWPGHPATAHWGFPDPSIVTDESARLAAFERVFRQIRARLETLAALPYEALGPQTLAESLRRIGAAQ